MRTNHRRPLLALVVALAASLAAVLPSAPATAGPVGPGAVDPRFRTFDENLAAAAGAAEAFARPLPLADGTTLVVVRVAGGSRVARFAADGTRDTTYGFAGTFAPTLGAGELFIAEIAVVPAGLADAGSVVFVGRAGTTALIGRITPAGGLDTSFGSGGFRLIGATTAGYDPAGFERVVVEADGSLTVVGRERATGGGTDEDLVVGRYTADGAPQPGFGGSGGLVVVPDTAGTTYAVTDAVRTDGPADGRVRTVAAGTRTAPGAQASAWVLAFDAGGAPMLTPADLDGDAASYDEIAGLAPAGDGEVAAVGLSDGSPVFARYTVDELIGTVNRRALSGTAAGLRTLPASAVLGVYGVDRDDRGAFVVLGTQPSGFAPGDTRLVRVDATGQLDPSAAPWAADPALSVGGGTFQGTGPDVAVGPGGTVVLTGGNIGGGAPIRPFLARYLGRTAALAVSLTPAAPAGAGQAQAVTVVVANSGADTAPVAVRVDLPSGLAPLSVPAGCVAAPTRITCSVEVAVGTPRSLPLTLLRTGDAAVGVQAQAASGYYDTSSAADDVAATVLAGQAYTFGRAGSACGASVKKACKVKRGSKPAYRLTATSVLPVPAAASTASVQVQRQVGKRWVRVKRPALRAVFAATTASVTVPKKLRATKAVYRVRLVVPATSVSAPATTSWRYLRVR